MLLDPGCVALPLGELGLPIVLPLGELGLPIEREDPGVSEGMPLPGDVPPPAVWLWTNAGSVNAAILTARNACHSLLFILCYSFLIQSAKARLYKVKIIRV
jgi:hypothetical protein